MAICEFCRGRVSCVMNQAGGFFARMGTQQPAERDRYLKIDARSNAGSTEITYRYYEVSFDDADLFPNAPPIELSGQESAIAALSGRPFSATTAKNPPTMCRRKCPIRQGVLIVAIGRVVGQPEDVHHSQPFPIR